VAWVSRVALAWPKKRITNCVTYQNEYFGILISGYWQDDPDNAIGSLIYVSMGVSCSLEDNLKELQGRTRRVTSSAGPPWQWRVP
jgi:hypothetical protein